MRKFGKINIKFANGRVHGIKSLRFNSVLECGLIARDLIGFHKLWHFTYKPIDCENCLRKIGKPTATDLSDYHSFIEE